MKAITFKSAVTASFLALIAATAIPAQAADCDDAHKASASESKSQPKMPQTQEEQRRWFELYGGA